MFHCGFGEIFHQPLEVNDLDMTLLVSKCSFLEDPLMWELTVDGSVTQGCAWPPSLSPLLLLLPLLFQPSPDHYVEAASSLFNRMSRKGSIVSACLKYRVSLNNLLPLFRRCCDSEGVLSSLTWTPCGCCSHCKAAHSTMKRWQAAYSLERKTRLRVKGTAFCWYCLVNTDRAMIAHTLLILVHAEVQAAQKAEFGVAHYCSSRPSRPIAAPFPQRTGLGMT